MVLKNIQNALKPIRGVIRNQTTAQNGAHILGAQSRVRRHPSIIHGIALAETWRPVDLSAAAADLPLKYMGIPSPTCRSTTF